MDLSTLLLGLSAWEVHVLWTRKSQLGAHRPPSWQFVTGRCKACSEGTPYLSIHALSTEQTMANDMVPAQWGCKLNSRQACHPKTISSTYTFISQFQGQKQRLESFCFLQNTVHLKRDLNLTSLNISNVCSSNVRKHESENKCCHSLIDN